MDKFSKEKRSKIMSSIKSKDSKIEIMLRKALWKRGYRYRINYPEVIGKPDIVFVKKKVAIFCDGEFWHGYDWEKRKYEIKSNQKFWHEKIEKNIKRDEDVNISLNKQGWKVIRFWGKDIEKNLPKCIETIEDALK